MLLFRSLSLGFLGACLLLVATKPPVIVEQVTAPCARSVPSLACPPIAAGPTILDVSMTASSSDVARMLHLGADERIAAVDDRAVANTLDAGVSLAQAYTGRGRYIDLDVRGPAGDRRVLVLVH